MTPIKPLFCILVIYLTTTSCIRLRQMDDDDDDVEKATALTNQQPQENLDDIWSENHQWKDTDDVELPTNDEQIPWILVNDEVDDTVAEIENDENSSRSKRQDEEAEFEGSGTDEPSPPLLPTNNNVTIDETNVNNEESPVNTFSADVEGASIAETNTTTDYNNSETTPSDSTGNNQRFAATNAEEQEQTGGVPQGSSTIVIEHQLDCNQTIENGTIENTTLVSVYNCTTFSNGIETDGEVNKQRAAVGGGNITDISDETKKSEAAVTTATEKSGGGKVTLLIVAGIIIVGAAAFTYHYCKRKMTTSNEETDPKDRELVEITINKRVDPQQEAEKTDNKNSYNEQKPLLDKNNRQNSNSVEISEVKEEEEEDDEVEKEKEQLQNGAREEKH